MELSIKASGKVNKDMVMEFKFGQMVLSMRAIGLTIKLMEEAD